MSLFSSTFSTLVLNIFSNGYDGRLSMHQFIDTNLLYRYILLLDSSLYPFQSYNDIFKLEYQKVLGDDSSKILIFFDGSASGLSRHIRIRSHPYSWWQYQLLQKGVVKSWLGPLTTQKKGEIHELFILKNLLLSSQISLSKTKCRTL